MPDRKLNLLIIVKAILKLSLLIVGFTLASCSKSPKCWGDDVNKGIITESVTIRCFPASSETQFSIDSDSSYANVFDAACELPSIDFSRYTLLGIYTEGQCKTKYIREVEKQESKKNYHYKVEIKNCGTCKKMAVSYNWVLVPKVPPGWLVTYEVENK